MASEASQLAQCPSHLDMASEASQRAVHAAIVAVEDSQPAGMETVIDPVDDGEGDEGVILNKDAFLEVAATSLGEAAMCFLCGQPCELVDCVVKVRAKLRPETSKFSCPGCNAVSVMLNRHMKWPPPDFSSLPVADQTYFWKSCLESADPSGRFKYENIRAKLVKRIMTRKMHAQTAEEYTDPRPLEVWAREGWDKEMIEEKGKKVWNSVAGWLYEVPLLRRSRKVTIEEVEERITMAEQSVKERKRKTKVAGDESEDILEIVSEDEAIPAAKQLKAGKGSVASGPKQQAAENKKLEAAIKKTNNAVQVLATKVVAATAKPLDELKKTVNSVNKDTDKFSTAFKEQLSENFNVLDKMNKDASNILKRSGQAASKGERQAPLDFDIKHVTDVLATVKLQLKNYVMICKSFSKL